MKTNKELVAYLQEEGVLRTSRLIAAFTKVDRGDFVPEGSRNEAYEDHPLPLGHSQTISQPYTVAFMLELLSPREGDRILDIGSGSGWTTALLAHAVGEHGYVLALEIVPELILLGRKNLLQYDLANAEVREAGELPGAPEEEPFDRILVSAAADELPQTLLYQLKPGGILVIPVQNDVLKVTKLVDGDIQVESYPGFSFVPLINTQ